MTDRPESPWILVVDDTAAMRTLMRRALTAHGYAVDAASTLADARTMRPAGYDGVVVDAHLGDGRGTDLVHEMILEDPAAATRCLVITGGGAGALPDGVSLLAKPFSPSELLAAVRALHPPAARPPAPPEPARPPAPPEPARPPAPPEPSLPLARSASEARATPFAPATGGARTAIPDTVAPATAVAPATRAAPATEVVPATGVGQAATPGTVAQAAMPEARATAGELPAGPLLEIVRRLRAAERECLVDVLHDGPVQELAAVTLALHLLRRSAASDVAGQIGALQEQLDKANRMLRRLIDGGWPFLREETRLADALTERTAWLLTTPLTVRLLDGKGREPAEVSGVVDLVELMLFALAAGHPPARAEAVIGVARHRTSIELILTPQAQDASPGYQAAVRSALATLASALGAEIEAEICPERWRAAVTIHADGHGQSVTPLPE